MWIADDLGELMAMIAELREAAENEIRELDASVALHEQNRTNLRTTIDRWFFGWEEITESVARIGRVEILDGIDPKLPRPGGSLNYEGSRAALQRLRQACEMVLDAPARIAEQNADRTNWGQVHVLLEFSKAPDAWGEVQRQSQAAAWNAQYGGCAWWKPLTGKQLGQLIRDRKKKVAKRIG